MSERKCDICGRPVLAAYRPFCSKRCSDLDLQRWLTGAYVIEGRPEDEGEGASPSQDDADG